MNASNYKAWLTQTALAYRARADADVCFAAAAALMSDPFLSASLIGRHLGSAFWYRETAANLLAEAKLAGLLHASELCRFPP